MRILIAHGFLCARKPVWSVEMVMKDTQSEGALIVIRHSDFVISPIGIGLRRMRLKKVALRFPGC